MENFKNKYDFIGEFHQGVAIIRKYDKFGAVMVGGKEIVPSIYDELSEFKDGYAVAKWNDEERVINLSGQIRVLNGDKEIFLPEEYDWGFDFIEDICVVVKNDKYGIIDKNFNVKNECEYDSFSNYHNGYGVFSKCRFSKWSDNVWSDDFLIDNRGNVNYKISESFNDGHKIVCSVDDQDRLYGVMNNNMQIIIPVIYNQICRLKNGLFIADNKENTKLFIHPEDGKVISEKAIDDIVDISKDFFCTYREDKIQSNWETCIYTDPESLRLCIPSKLYVKSDEDGNVIFEYRNLEYRYDLKGELYVIAKKTYYGAESWMFRWDKIIERKVKYEYLDYNHKPFSEKYEIIEDNQKKKGLSDVEGNVVISPQYMEIYPFNEEMFIVSMSLDSGTSQKFGVVDIFNNIKIPLTFNYLIPINDKFLAYTDNELNIRENYKLSLPSSFTYQDIRFGIIDVRGKKITQAIFSQITINIDNTVFIIRKDSGVGIIDCKGQYILNPKYNDITYNEQNSTYTTSIQYCESGNYPFEIRTNRVSLDGCYIVKNHIGEIVEVPSQIVDWCGDFSENGIAHVIKDGYSGHINKLNQFVSFVDGNELIMPSKYEYILDFTCGYAPVLLGGKWGILNTKLELIIPCEYDYIEALSDSLFKFRAGDKWGLVNTYGTIIAEADYVNIAYETENLLKIESYVQNGSSRELRYGLLDNKGTTIIPAHCRTITRVEQCDDIFFIVEKTWEKGVLDKKGNIIVPFIYNYISDGGSPFYCLYSNSYGINDNKFHSFYKTNGERYICIDIDKDCCQMVAIPAGYEYAAYAGYGIVKVSQSGKWGLVDTLGDIITEPQYSIIDIFDGSFAKVGKCLEKKKSQYGLIDTTGEVVLPIEYDKIEKWDNGYYVIQKNELYGLLSPTLHVVIEPCKNYLKKLDNNYILVKCPGGYSDWELIDYYGNEVFPADGGQSGFTEIEVLENGFLKVIFYRNQYHNSCIGIFNSKGKQIYNNYECDDITYLEDGLLLVNRFLYTSYEGAGHSTYNLVNLQGKELFDTYYDSIEVLKNGNISLYKNKCYGMAKNTGEVFIPTKYNNVIKFDKGIAEIKISEDKPLHKINEDGQIIVLDEDKNEVIIPKDYYWGTDFNNGVSIVRSIKNDKLGVINKQGDVLITPEYDTIDLLVDKTIQVAKCNYYGEEYNYGLYDISGKCIFPVIFRVFEHLDKNRIRVVWNLNEIQSWCPGEYTPGPNKYIGNNVEYGVNNRSALCDVKGNIINNKNFVCVGKFRNGYARSSLTLCIEDNQVYLRQVGVIDINGQTVVPPKYDGIVLYEHSYARLRKGKKYGIADLKNKKTILFKDIHIKKPGVVDSFGRFVYTDGGCSNNLTKNKGVLGPDGVVLPSGTYSNIKLLENGLIIVSNEDKTLYGLFGVKGEEVLKMEYSYISPFKYGYATVCIGGHNQDEYPYKPVGGKWGAIDKTGKFIIKCIHDEEQLLSADDILKYNLLDVTEFDSYGRLLFYERKEKNRYNIGVIGVNGIIVSIGKYPNIQLLENGLIKVSNEKETFGSFGILYGLLDAEGKELLEMKYSYISSFNDGYASICIGGHNTNLMLYAHAGGKWGVIDKTGKIVVECIHDDDQLESLKDIIVLESSETSECNFPKVISSDSITVNVSYEMDDDNYSRGYDDDSGGYDNEPSIYDNPYYNDNLDMDQQSIEFWNNI